MHRMIRLALTSLLALGLSGCGSGKPIHYYTVQLLPAAHARDEHPSCVSIGWKHQRAGNLCGHADCVSHRHQRDWHLPVQSLGRAAQSNCSRIN